MNPIIVISAGVGVVVGALLLGTCGATPADAVTGAVITRVSAGGGTASCPAGSFVVGGGCVDNGSCTDPRIKESYPSSSTAWACGMACTSGSLSVMTFALCASTTPPGAITGQ